MSTLTIVLLVFLGITLAVGLGLTVYSYVKDEKHDH